DASTDTDGGDARDGGDAKDAEVAPPPRCPQTINCADGGYDGSAGVCAIDAGVCVECLEDGDCASKPKTPICEDQLCRACKADSECKAGPGTCMFHQDGHCATDDETIYVESKTGCLSAPSTTGGTAAAPFCKLQEALSAIGTRRLLLVRGSGDVGNTVIQNVSGGQISIVGPGTRITAAVGSPGLK